MKVIKLKTISVKYLFSLLLLLYCSVLHWQKCEPINKYILRLTFENIYNRRASFSVINCPDKKYKNLKLRRKKFIYKKKSILQIVIIFTSNNIDIKFHLNTM